MITNKHWNSAHLQSFDATVDTDRLSNPTMGMACSAGRVWSGKWRGKLRNYELYILIAVVLY